MQTYSSYNFLNRVFLMIIYVLLNEKSTYTTPSQNKVMQYSE